MVTTCPCGHTLSASVILRASKGAKVTGLCASCYRASIVVTRSCCECGARLANCRAIRCQPCNNRHLAADPVREARRIAKAKAAFWRPEVRERHDRANAAFGARRLAWCPEDRRDEYRRLVKIFGAAEARGIIERSIKPVAKSWSFEDQLARVEAGAGIASVPVLPSSVHGFTIGGVAVYGA